VINTGTPIPDEDREKIFERFYRGDKARSRDENHYGLGLAIARRIARNHNGDIRAYSENGDTIFDIELR
jgi:signal transduction histidine kinase